MEQKASIEEVSYKERENTSGPSQLKRREFVRENPGRKLRISIITVTYNSGLTIGDTLKSVRGQDYPEIEHILIDGQSGDNTMSIINSYPHVAMCISEKDEGMYDAMNKGIMLATGDVIGILNSDDIYSHNSVLSKVAERFETGNAAALYADLNYVGAINTNKIHRRWKSGSFTRNSFFFGWMPPHPTFFVKKEVYEKLGLYNILLKRSADYEMMLRILFKHQLHATYLHEVLVKMRLGGTSNSSLKIRLEANKEDKLAWKLNGLKPYFFTFHLKPLRKIFQFVNKNTIANILFNK